MLAIFDSFSITLREFWVPLYLYVVVQGMRCGLEFGMAIVRGSHGLLMVIPLYLADITCTESVVPVVYVYVLDYSLWIIYIIPTSLLVTSLPINLPSSHSYAQPYKWLRYYGKSALKPMIAPSKLGVQKGNGRSFHSLASQSNNQEVPACKVSNYLHLSIPKHVLTCMSKMPRGSRAAPFSVRAMCTLCPLVL